jgi:hypothetical protein
LVQGRAEFGAAPDLAAALIGKRMHVAVFKVLSLRIVRLRAPAIVAVFVGC